MELLVFGAFVAIAVIAYFIYESYKRQQAQEQAGRELRGIAEDLAQQQHSLATLQLTVQQKRSELKLEQVVIHNTLSLTALKQLHSESHRIGNAWYDTLESAKHSRDEFRRHIDRLKSSRRYHAQRRTGTKNGQRAYHARSGQTITLSIDGLYSALGGINREIEAIRSELQAHNRRTAELRDFIGVNCGQAGRQWHQQLMARTANRRRALPQ